MSVRDQSFLTKRKGDARHFATGEMCGQGGLLFIVTTVDGSTGPERRPFPVKSVNTCPSALSRRSVPLQNKTPAYLPHRQRVHEVLARPRRNTAHSRQSRLACNTVATIDGGVLFVPGNVVYALHRGWGGRLPRPPGLSFGEPGSRSRCLPGALVGSDGYEFEELGGRRL
jgi:hypothetical protein